MGTAVGVDCTGVTATELRAGAVAAVLDATGAGAGVGVLAGATATGDDAGADDEDPLEVTEAILGRFNEDPRDGVVSEEGTSKDLYKSTFRDATGAVVGDGACGGVTANEGVDACKPLFRVSSDMSGFVATAGATVGIRGTCAEVIVITFGGATGEG